MITVCTWLWGNKYNEQDVQRLRIGVSRHLKQRHRFICVTDQPLLSGGITQTTIPLVDWALLKKPGCFARLRMFDPLWQSEIGVLHDRLVCMDLDSVVTGPLDPLFDRPEPLVILQGANAANPCPYNGSLMMLRYGAHPQVWRDFTLERAAEIPHYEFPDDQGWIHYKIKNAAGWKAGPESGVYAFQKPGWPVGSNDLPSGARLVVFPGARSPAKFSKLPWIQQNWTSLSSSPLN